VARTWSSPTDRGVPEWMMSVSSVMEEECEFKEEDMGRKRC
jgi:hypothetical protein